MKKIISSMLAIIIVLSSFGSAFSVYAATGILGRSAFINALKNGGDYQLSALVLAVSGASINNDVTLDGKGRSISASSDNDTATIYQNDNVTSSFSNLTVNGASKGDVGIWVGSGSMSFYNSTITGYTITSGRYTAIAVGNSARLTLNDTTLSNNKDYDVQVNDSATLNLNGSTTFSKLRVSTSFAKINIGKSFSGSFSITFDSPVAKVIGTVADGADISGISVSNSGYYLESNGGKLVLRAESEKAVHFDMSSRKTLYKGSTGFLYGEAEINVPSIDLLSGLKPDTMVQKAYGGKQHPTGDAVRTGSALLASGVRDMQIYLQDHYLEWPYDAPMTDNTIDLDAYQQVVEEILYAMICDEANEGDEGAFLGSDGKYYVLNDTAEKYSYVLFNEPDQIWYWGNLEGLERAWKKIYDAVHAIDPNARCAGPNFAGYNKDSYDSFLLYCYNNNCLPELITWHELGDISLTDFFTHYNEIKVMQAKYYTDDYAAKSGRKYQPELLVNEYARHYDIGAPGGLVKWLAMFEDKDMSGCMAYWAMANTLNEMAADQNSPTSTWWVYHWYAQMTGEQCPLVSPEFDETRFYGLTSYDEDINTAYVLFGGNEDEKGNEAVYLDNIDSTDLMNNNGAVDVKLYAVSFSGQLGANYKPEVIFDGAINAKDNSLKIAVGNTDEMQAYYAVLTKPEDDVSAVEGQNFEYPVLCYEAENAELLGGATAYTKGGWATFATSGRGDVGSINNNGDGVRFTINVPEDGYYNASLFYSLQAPYVNPKTLEPAANGQNRGIGKTLPYGVELDGNELDNILLESTVVWSYKNHNDIKLYLTAGEHMLTFKHINGDQGDKGNLQLVAALDKLDISKYDENENNFEICLNEMENFKDGSEYRVTAVAPEQGYYTVSADGEFSLKKQCVDYAADAKSFSKCSVYDTPVGKTVYLAKGANTIVAEGDISKLVFTYNSEATENESTVINSYSITTHGNPVLKENEYANSGYVISELGVGQDLSSDETAQYNYSTFSINAPSKGMYDFAIRYANDEPAPIMQKADGSTYIHPYNIDLVERYAQISVNGAEPETVYFKNTLSWETFRILDVQLELEEGINTVRIYNDNSYQFSNLVNSTAPEIDTVTVSKLSSDGEKAEFISGNPSETHSFEVVETVEPTNTEIGYIKYKCSKCDKVYYEYLSKLIDWSPIASSDFTKAQAATNATLGELPTYNGMGRKMTWNTGLYTQNGDASKSDDGAIYIPDGYMYLSGYSGGSVPISGYSKWKIDFGFRFKDDITENYSDYTDKHCFMKLFVYTDSLSNPPLTDTNYATEMYNNCYFAQDANGRCYTWKSDYVVGKKSADTSISTGSENLKAGVNYHYIAEFDGDSFNAYITDENGELVQRIVSTTNSEFITHLRNSSTQTVTSMKIGDDNNADFFRGLEYRNITFYCDKNEFGSDASALKAAIKQAHSYTEAEYTAESIAQLYEIADSYIELSESTVPQEQYDEATQVILEAIENLDSYSDYSLVSFGNDTALLENSEGKYLILKFSDYINGYCAALDVVEDGIINAKDFAYLLKNY